MFFDAKGCPVCGVILRGYVVPDRSTVGRHVFGVFLFWAAITLWFAWLRSPRGDGDLYAFLGFLATIVWVVVRSRQRADRKAGIDRQRYYCEQCGRHYEDQGADLREIHVKQIREIKR